jgi:DNA-directed RNA polymerase I and III subunit RPAC1
VSPTSGHLSLTVMTDALVNVESAGQYNPEELVPEAIKILLAKISAVEQGLDKLFESDGTAA